MNSKKNYSRSEGATDGQVKDDGNSNLYPYLSISHLIQESDAYLLITPAKNEEDSLPRLISSIKKQIIKPVIWVIVDDGSIDTTKKIILKAECDNIWIYGLYLSSTNEYNIEEHYSNICQTGFNFAIQLAEQKGLQYNYIALSDADMIFPDNYFSNLIEFLHDNHDYGLVSGSLEIILKNGSSYVESKRNPGNDFPIGAARIWRKKTFLETGGYRNVRAPDTVSTILAIIKGWKTAKLNNLICYQTRETGSKISIWNGYKKRGQRAYYLNSNPLSVMNVIFDLIFISRQRHAIRKSIAYLFGFLISLIRKDEKISILEVKDYNGSYKRTINNYYNFYLLLIKKNL